MLRFVPLLVVTGLFVLTLFGLAAAPWLVVLSVILGSLVLLGLYDFFQSRHTLWRNFPIIAHIRWIAEELHPFLRSYIVESETEGRPFNNEQRALIYRRAKNVSSVEPFGSHLDIDKPPYEWLAHSIAAKHTADDCPRIVVGAPGTKQPYSASVLNISAMSFGSLGAHAIEALSTGAKKGDFYHDTGEGGVSRYHRAGGADLVWELGSGYFGCRARDGRFDAARFKDVAQDPQIKMIEIKLSQGAKPGHGGVLPGAKVTAEIAEARGVPVGETCVSPPGHTAFSTPIEMMEFAASLREMSGGKPAGKQTSAFAIASSMALGADWINTARGFMFSLGCIQSLNCHNNTCPTGIATTDKGRQRGLVIADKAERVYNFHRNTMKALMEVVGAAGLEHPAELTPRHIMHRVTEDIVKPAHRAYDLLDANVLINAPEETKLANEWAMAQAASFKPLNI